MKIKPWPLLISYLIGVSIFYVFLCFYGVILATLNDIEIYKLIFKKIVLFSDSKLIRKIIFEIIGLTQSYLTLCLITILFTYFNIEKIYKNRISNKIFIIIGAVSCDFILEMTLNKNLDFSYFTFSLFFENTIISLIINLISWFIIISLAIEIANKLKSQKKWHNNTLKHDARARQF